MYLRDDGGAPGGDAGARAGQKAARSGEAYAGDAKLRAVSAWMRALGRHACGEPPPSAAAERRLPPLQLSFAQLVGALAEQLRADLGGDAAAVAAWLRTLVHARFD